MHCSSRLVLRPWVPFLSVLLVVAVPVLGAPVPFVDQVVISTETGAPKTVFAADLDGDNDLDVLTGSHILGTDEVHWYENTTGEGVFDAAQVIATAPLNDVASVFAAKLDGDNDLDVLIAAASSIIYYENDSGDGSAWTPHVITNSASSAQAVFAADVDGDNDLDVLSASYSDNKVAWYENTDGLGNFGGQQIISSTSLGARSVFAADLDGDNDVDVLSVQDPGFTVNDTVEWHENLLGDGSSWTTHTIASVQNPNQVIAVNVDGDADLDAVYTSSLNNRVAWSENLGGGNFDALQIISTAANAPVAIYAADLDLDTDMDIVSAAHLDGEINWHENLTGIGSSWTTRTISTAAAGAQAVFCGDLDGDGDLDVLSASEDDDKVAWYENLTIVSTVPGLGWVGKVLLAGLLILLALGLPVWRRGRAIS